MMNMISFIYQSDHHPGYLTRIHHIIGTVTLTMQTPAVKPTIPTFSTKTFTPSMEVYHAHGWIPSSSYLSPVGGGDLS